VAESSLSTFDKSSANRTNSEGSPIGIDNVEINDRSDVDIDVIFSHTDLRWNFKNSNFDVNLLQSLAQSES
jgi:hypothetical protein